MQLLFLIMAFCLVLVSGSAIQADDEVNTPQAEAAFREGVEHFRANRYDEAALAFRRADEIKPNWKIQYNIGQCEAAAKNYAAALEGFEAYLAKGGDGVSVDRQEKVIAEISRLKAMVGVVEIQGEDGDVVLINGKELGALPSAARVKVAIGSTVIEIITRA